MNINTLKFICLLHLGSAQTGGKVGKSGHLPRRDMFFSQLNGIQMPSSHSKQSQAD